MATMAPYLFRGLGEFPGSWFWDGWAYLSVGEAIWYFPRGGVATTDLSPLYQLGLLVARGRFLSSALIVELQGILPLGGDSQNSVGYFLFLAVFVLATSMTALARRLINDFPAHLCVPLLVTCSGPTLTLLHANNFDQLLIVALFPSLVTAAYVLEWRDLKGMILLGLIAAATCYAYAELAALFLLAPAAILIQRWITEAPPSLQALGVMGVIILSSVIALLPYLPTLIRIPLEQL